jgi:glycerol-3-phosphate dehydrogenase
MRAAHQALPPDVVDHLVSSYGTEAEDVIALGLTRDRGLEQLSPGRESIEAEVHFAVEREMALRLEDVVMRRTGLGTLGHPGRDCLDRVAAIMRGALGWSDEEARTQLARLEETLGSDYGAGYRSGH